MGVTDTATFGPRRPACLSHNGSEVIYVFDNLRMKDYPWTDLDRRIADMLSGLSKLEPENGGDAPEPHKRL